MTMWPSILGAVGCLFRKHPKRLAVAGSALP
jgi:hypothetical protein